MFILFSYQPELFLSPNFIFSPALFSYSAVFIIGGVSSSIIFLYIVYLQGIKKKIPPDSVLWLGITLAWLPLFLNFIYGGLRDSQGVIITLPLTTADQAQNRYCKIDQAQSLNNFYCNIPALVKEIYSEVPQGAHIFLLVSDTTQPFFEYQLASDYYVTNTSDEIDYIIVYFPEIPLYAEESISNGPIFSFTNNNQHISRFKIKKRIKDQVLILERLNF